MFRSTMDSNATDNKVIRAPSLKRGKNDERLCDRIKLKKVLGLTVCSNAALDVSPTNGVLAYPAGCTVVLFNAKKLTQSYLVNTSRKAITAVAYSQCGRYVATGECGISPAIKVWELDGQSSNGEGGTGGTVVAEFLGHKYAVSCIAFSPTGKYLVSVGSQHDMIVNVFDWKVNLKIASNKVSAKVAAVSFSADGNYFVTVGNRHVKYWYLEGSRKYKEPIPLMGRSAILGELRDNDFCAVACGKGDCSDSTYAITRVGHLVEFNSRRLLDKWVACRTTSANCICANAHYILVGCAEAIIRIFNAATLEYVTTLPRTHYLGVEVSSGVHINHIMTAPQSARYPDTIAMVFDEVRSKVACVYNDHSLYIWDLRDVRRVGKSHSFLYHSACIWGVETVPLDLENNTNPALPESCFLTCSSDDTIRVWGLDDCPNTDVYRKNIYSKELLKVVYIDNELNFIKDTDNPILSTEKTSSYDGRNGVRCIKINSEKNHLATGDRSGNIRIYNLVTLKQITMIEAHDSEVLCLEYTHEKIEKKLLASASRDRLIHVFDVNQGYNILQTLDDHSSSITSVKFIGTGNNFQMISCGADKSIMFRAFQNNQFLRGTNCSGKTTLYDMEVDSNGKHILTACQDRNIRVYGTHNAKHTKTFKGSHSDDGSLIKLSLDPSGIYIATSCTDKTLSVYDYYSNECMARMYGHSELVTGLRFTNDCKYLISASGDGCVFIWQIPHDMIVTMQARLSQQRLRSGHMPIPRPVSNSVTDIIIDSPTRDHEQFSSSPSHLFIEDAPLTPGYRFSDVGQLPQWAKRKGQDEPQANSSIALSSSPSQSQMVKPRGRWAQRGQDPDPLDLRGTADSSLSSTYTNAMQTSDYNSGSSKDIYNQANLSEDSSIDSGMENRKDKPFRTKIVGEQKKGTSLRFESNNDHDGDVEDISDGERTSSDHGMMFYQNAGPSTPTDFKVNAMNEDELRKSVRRQKFEKLGLALKASEQSAPSTGTGTGTSDTEDEGSTPSGENADRSLASTLGGSSESIPQQASSSFLQAALDGPGSLSDRSDKKRRSISAKHNTESKSSTSYSKFYTNSKKEELLKVINEAKAKLENVGYRSNLRGSQSISDLTHASNTTETTLRVSRINRTGNPKSLMSVNNDDSPIRRACSLSDLSLGKGATKPTATTRTNVPVRTPSKRQTSVGPKSSSNLGSRSNSVGVLNQSDSETDTLTSRGGIMRPTLSSQNRANSTGVSRQYPSKSNATTPSRRKGLQNSYSSVNLSTPAQDDSSSEEAQSGPPSSSKPAVPPRPRSMMIDHKKSSISTGKLRGNTDSFGGGDLSMSPDSTSQLCSNIISMLNTTTNAVLQLHSRLKHSDETSGSRNNNLMLKELENAVIMTQNMLTKITNKSDNNNMHVSFAPNEQHNSLENGDYLLMMNKCADLLNKVRNKHKSNDCENET
ncbi:mitogen-activated protein kinase-binding protein 1 isoform X7 [Hermetia illucens]|uniref:mitogen-activated protein kinase-binding protein 1 isoform X7 n=1 Tax=Hermetia illucens TaxID=343691 RepID=UPI0018CC05AE|nr:mitogen-activated protein kinase-binding protein 1 isoform X7 [Hermetia illucens]